MACDFPLKAYRSASQRGPSGKPLITFNPQEAINSTQAMELPCNNCMGCKLEKSRQWSIRMMHEKKQFEHNCFLTLTYNDQAVPRSYSLNLRDLQLFFKRLRKKLPHKIRFFACGEYGDLNGRPHYHAIVFNHDFHDKKIHSYNHQNQPIYTSQTLTDLWRLGHATTQDVTHQSCAYVARYVTKKLKTGDDFGAQRYYRRSPIDGEMHSVKPEFATQSTKPGLGFNYVEQFKTDFYPSGYIVVNGVRQAPPQYYLSKLTEEERKRLKLYRPRKPRAVRLKEATMERRQARAAVRDARITSLKRKL